MYPKDLNSNLYRFVFILFIVSHKLISKDLPLTKPDTLKAVVTGWKSEAHIISLGFGIPSYIGYKANSMLKPTNSYTISSLTRSVNLHLKFEVFVFKHLGLGTTINYGKVNYNCLHEVRTPYTREIENAYISTEVVSMNVRLNYHFLYNRTVDIYLGGGTGLRFVKTNGNYNFLPDIYPSGIFKEYELSLGVRYFSNGIAGVFAEVGLGRTLFQAGVNFNIKSGYLWNNTRNTSYL